MSSRWRIGVDAKSAGREVELEAEVGNAAPAPVRTVAAAGRVPAGHRAVAARD